MLNHILDWFQLVLELALFTNEKVMFFFTESKYSKNCTINPPFKEMFSIWNVKCVSLIIQGV